MHPRLYMKVIDKRKRERDAKRQRAIDQSLAFGVVESIEWMTGRSPRPHSIWPAIGSYLLGLVALIAALGLAARYLPSL